MDAIEKNIVLCREYLNTDEISADLQIKGYQGYDDIQWFRIKGLTRFWESSKGAGYNRIFEDIISSIVLSGSVYCFLLRGDEKGLGFYFGTNEELEESLIETYQSYVPGIDIERGIDYESLRLPVRFGGLITGYPVDKGKGNPDQVVLQIDNICRGMLGSDFAFLIVASRLPALLGSAAVTTINQELKQCSLEMNQSVTMEMALGNETKQVMDFDIQNYSKNIELLGQMIKEGMANGIWSYSGYYMAAEETSALKFRGILKASYGGVAENQFEAFRCIPMDGSLSFLKTGVGLVTDADPYAVRHPVGEVYSTELQEQLPFYQYTYQTIVSTGALAVFYRMPRTEFEGFYIDNYVEFDTSSRVKNHVELRIGSVSAPGRQAVSSINNNYSVELDDLTRHALIIGITGGGKTNTSKSLLSNLWVIHQIPFLVIESAKREYWNLMNLDLEASQIKKSTEEDERGRNYDCLTVFTLGSEETGKSVPFRMNPFEVAGEVSIQTHIDYLLSTFKASFELYAPMPYVLETAVYEIYDDRGWDIVENCNRYGLAEYPTLTDLYYKIDVVTDRLGYHTEVQSNVKAALKARINSLRIGGKGAMMDIPRGIDIGILLNTPTILELEDLGDDDTKSFVIGILLVQLYEYRKAQVQEVKGLKHVLMIEEAHRLLKNIPLSSEAGNAAGKSVEFFCNMLAEIRSFGQGILIADQVPAKLAPDTIKNTNLKILHRTVMKEDREVMGYAMNMTAEQIDYISSLRRGCAAVYAEGDSNPKLVMMPLMHGKQNRLSRGAVLEKCRSRLQSLMNDYAVKYKYHKGCMMCEHRCLHHDTVRALYSKSDVSMLTEQIRSGGKLNIPIIDRYIISLEKTAERQLEVFEKVCAVGDLLNSLKLSEEKQAAFIVAYCVAVYGREFIREQE